MAWRIHHSITRGEIDNRERGSVRGKLWLHGVAEPIVLELEGNACADLAGCQLSFHNSGSTCALPHDANFSSLQRGRIGDLTASRKVRVPDVSLAEFVRLREAGLPAPEHLANCLYLEWFSEANGRVVIESTDYQLTISAPAWRLTPEEEERRQTEAAAGFSSFMDKLSQAVESKKHEPGHEKEWDEFDYEKFMRESDARTDKYMELLDKYRDHPDCDAIVEREMGWATDEDGIAETGEPGDEKADPFDFDEINEVCADAADNPPAPDPASEGVDWVRDEDGDVSHPLALRAFNGSLAVWEKCEEFEMGKASDDDLAALLTEYQITSAKLAGALDSLAYGRDRKRGAFVVAYLKRALGHLHGAQAALEKVAPKRLLPSDFLAATRAEMFGIREEILRLMEEFRHLR